MLCPPLLLRFGICGLHEKFSGAFNFDFSPIYVEPGQRWHYNNVAGRPRNRVSIPDTNNRFLSISNRSGRFLGQPGLLFSGYQGFRG
jgi:hypothetical protein